MLVCSGHRHMSGRKMRLPADLKGRTTRLIAMAILSPLKLTSIVLVCLVLGSASGYAVAYLLYLPKITGLESELSTAKTGLTEEQKRYDQLSINNTRLISMYSELNSSYADVVSEFSGLKSDYLNLKSRWDRILQKTKTDQVATTILYYTDFGRVSNLININISYDTYRRYHEVFDHPWLAKSDAGPARAYITPDEPVIEFMVTIVKAQTNDEEELADALLDLVQDKSHVLSVRYYPTLEYKYPVETLVEMGGDCDTHAFLYATLLKAAGFRVLLLLSTDRTHAAVAVHLNNDPKNSATKQLRYFTVDGLRYYYAETTSWGWRVGDLPPDMSELTFSILLI